MSILKRIIFERYYWDAFYVDHAGFGLDLRILGRTVVNLLPRLIPEDPAAIYQFNPPKAEDQPAEG